MCPARWLPAVKRVGGSGLCEVRNVEATAGISLVHCSAARNANSPGVAGERWLALQACFPETWEPCYRTGVTNLWVATSTTTAVIFAWNAAICPRSLKSLASTFRLQPTAGALGLRPFLGHILPINSLQCLHFCLLLILKATHSINYHLIS